MGRRALFLTRHSHAAASCRHRALQYIPYLESRGWSVEHWPLLTETYTKELLRDGHRSLWEAVRCYARRTRKLASAETLNFDVVFVQAELLPWVPFGIEDALLFGRHPAVVVDYDDAIYAQYAGTLLGRKIEKIIGSARAVVAGNQTLYRYASQFNRDVTQIPTVIDLDKYSPKTSYEIAPGLLPVVGWIGTAATAQHLESCGDALRAVAQQHPFVLRCVGAPEGFRIQGVEVDRVAWTAASELERIRSFDLGIMPLTDDAIAGGKCGFKLIQYMAAGVPAIGQRLGANAEIITDRVDGLLASTTQEFVEKILLLIRDCGLRQRLGWAGRCRIESEYCVQRTAPRLERALLRACGGAGESASVRSRMFGSGEAAEAFPRVTVGIKQILDAASDYPRPEDSYSPDERFPEYPFQDLSSRPNPVYRMLRELLHEMGLDERRYGTPSWNPLGDWIGRGQSVFALVNFVNHRRPAQSTKDFAAMVTHASVIRALLDYIIIATGNAALVSFGNAPVQSAQMDRLAGETGAAVLREFYLRNTGYDLGPYDLRLYVSEVGLFGTQRAGIDHGSDSEVTFALGGESLLDSSEEASGDFRVEDYAGSATGRCHAGGRHLYKVHRKIVESDVIFHLAKLKTHGKVAVTGALKGIVGAVSHKECLAHHRRGPARQGNDEFRQSRAITRAYSRLGEFAATSGGNAARILYKTVGRALDRIGGIDIAGSWYGNDTAWRMALDINKCVIYGRRDGTLSATPVRKILSLLDGYVSGEGNGPLHVGSRQDGVLILSRDPCYADLGAALVMGFDPDRIPLIRESFRCDALPVSSAPAGAARFLLNGRVIAADEIPGKVVPRFRPPRGWIGHVEYPSNEAPRPRSYLAESFAGSVSSRD